LALPLLATANTPAQRKLGRYWKRLHRMTYVIWGLVVLHLLLLGRLTPFGVAEGDGDPIMHQRFYQAVAISIPLIVLRLPRRSAQPAGIGSTSRLSSPSSSAGARSSTAGRVMLRTRA
jgi:DMSO/TMAO reductase YedYZ heme-binding membrane subunit